MYLKKLRARGGGEGEEEEYPWEVTGQGTLIDEYEITPDTAYICASAGGSETFRARADDGGGGVSDVDSDWKVTPPTGPFVTVTNETEITVEVKEGGEEFRVDGGSWKTGGAGEYLVYAEDAADSNKNDESKLYVVKVDLTGSTTTTRGNDETYTATVAPGGLNPTFKWEFVGAGKTIEEDSGTTNTWAGAMVVSGTIEVTATVGPIECKETLPVTVNAREWGENYGAMQPGGNGNLPHNPRNPDDLGLSDLTGTYNFQVVYDDEGPNAGWIFVEDEPMDAYANTGYHNDDLYDVDCPFYRAQNASEGELTIEQTRENVRVHEGVDTKEGYDSHWSLGKAYLTDNPINATLESEVSHISDESLQDFRSGIIQWVENWKKAFKAAAEETEPENVHPGGADYSYPVISPKPGGTVNVGEDKQFSQTGGTAPITWTSSNTNVATVDNAGKVHGVAPGQVQIKATDKNGDEDVVKTEVVTP